MVPICHSCCSFLCDLSHSQRCLLQRARLSTHLHYPPHQENLTKAFHTYTMVSLVADDMMRRWEILDGKFAQLDMRLQSACDIAYTQSSDENLKEIVKELLPHRGGGQRQQMQRSMPAKQPGAPMGMLGGMGGMGMGGMGGMGMGMGQMPMNAMNGMNGMGYNAFDTMQGMGFPQGMPQNGPPPLANAAFVDVQQQQQQQQQYEDPISQGDMMQGEQASLNPDAAPWTPGA